MQLNIRERFVLPTMIQDKGSLSEQMIKESIIKKIRLTPEEIEKFNVVENDNGTVQWNKHVSTDVDICFTDVEMGLLKSCCNKLDQEKSITMDMLPICKKILGIDV